MYFVRKIMEKLELNFNYCQCLQYWGFKLQRVIKSKKIDFDYFGIDIWY